MFVRGRWSGCTRYTSFTPITAASSANGALRKRKWVTVCRYFHVSFCCVFLHLLNPPQYIHTFSGLNGAISQNTALFNPLNLELNPMCCLLALLGAHHFLHVSRIRVKSLTLRLLIIYIYIYIYMEHPFLMFLDHTQRHSTVGRTPLDE